MTESTSDQRAKRQLTRPKKGKPVEIPVPKRKDFERALKKAGEPARRK